MEHHNDIIPSHSLRGVPCRLFSRVMLLKVDLDTCLTGLCFGLDRDRNTSLVISRATFLDICDPSVLCIEAGGGGLGHLNNFDHHEPGLDLPPACIQAVDYVGIKDVGMLRLAEYVRLVDLALPLPEPIAFPALSSVFSGMLLLESDPLEQFRQGMSLLIHVLEQGVDPFQTLPDLPAWRPYIAAKEANAALLERDMAQAVITTTASGWTVGLLQTQAVGGAGALFAQGCDVAVLFAPAFGHPPVPKFTIAARERRVIDLLPVLDRIEPGWGGRDRIIGSPRRGSRLDAATVFDLVLRHVQADSEANVMPASR